MSSSFLLYGATGFTGRLIAARAVALGMHPVLAGRSESPLAAMAKELGVPFRVCPLDDKARLGEALAGVRCVLHAAGPFSVTSRPMVEACLAARRPYADISGEVAVIEAIAAQDGAAKEAGVMLLPGAGFDVVPSDCLAAHLKARLPSATKLRLAFLAATRLSPGTAATVIENMGRPGQVRRGGVLVEIPTGSLRGRFDFGDAGIIPTVAIPWGDLATAWRSTGIPDIETHMAAPFISRLGLAVSNAFGGIFRPLLRPLIRWTSSGPNERMRREARSVVLGEVSDEAGGFAAARLSTPEPYALTAETALAVVNRIFAGNAPPGFQTPATAYGADFIMETAGVFRKSVEPTR